MQVAKAAGQRGCVSTEDGNIAGCEEEVEHRLARIAYTDLKRFVRRLRRWTQIFESLIRMNTDRE